MPSLPRFHLAVRELCSQVGRGLHAATVGFLFSSSPRTSSIVKGPLQVRPASGENNNIANGQTTKPAGAYCGTTTHLWPASSVLLCRCRPTTEVSFWAQKPRGSKSGSVRAALYIENPSMVTREREKVEKNLLFRHWLKSATNRLKKKKKHSVQSKVNQYN